MALFASSESKSLRKLKELIMYIVTKCEGKDSFASTVLNKLLLYSDFYYYAKYGKPITGGKYQKAENGIIPTHLLQAREELIAEEKLMILNVDFHGFTQRKPMARIPFEAKHLNDKELQFVDEVIERFGDKNGKEISKHNHREAIYQYAMDGEEIPYFMAYFLGDAEIPAEILEKSVQTAKKLGYQFKR